MERELITRTNKAELFRLADGSLIKQYLPNRQPAEKVHQDQLSLQQLERSFGKVRRGGWRYRTVKLLDSAVDRQEVRLEFVSGTPLSEIARSKMNDAEFRCGVWLAVYHNKLLGGRHDGLIYWDFNVHNVIIDFDRRSVVAIDPGMSWGRHGFASQDLVRHMHSAVVTLVVRRRSSLPAVICFLKGYARTTNRPVHLRSYYQGLAREVRRQFYQYSRKSYLKCALYPLLLIAMSGFYLWFVPGYLLLKDWRRTRNRHC